MARMSVHDRFWAKVDRRGTEECWEWNGYRHPTGYGEFKLDGSRGAHRAALILSGVDVPKGSVVRHRCDNPPCVNPAHLVVGNQSENIIDMYSKGRANVPSGEAHHHGRKTHCPKGHPYSEANTKWRKAPLGGPGRTCRECHRAVKREGERRKRRAAGVPERGKRARWRG